MSFTSLGDASADEPRSQGTARRWTWGTAAFSASAGVLVAAGGEWAAAGVFAVLAVVPLAWLWVTRDGRNVPGREASR